MRILVLDDEQVILKICSRLLAQLGQEFDLAGDIAQARGFISRKVPYSLLITDLRLPDGNGWDLAKEFKKHYPVAKVIVITGSPNMLAKIPDEEIKSTEVLMKPFKMEDFQAAVKKALFKGLGGAA